jgi:hypothetical protein
MWRNITTAETEGASNLFPLAWFDLIEDETADKLLVEWGHWLGGCNRPFGRQSFGLGLAGKGIISVAVSASTVNGKCGGYSRQEVVELARLCSHPDFRWATRICLRLWRELAPGLWPYWPVKVCVSYADSLRHAGQVYRFDGWRKVAETRAGRAGPGSTWARRKEYNAKTVWAYELEAGGKEKP